MTVPEKNRENGTEELYKKIMHKNGNDIPIAKMMRDFQSL